MKSADSIGQIAVVVVTFNRITHLKKTLDRLLEESVPQSNIIVVNNNSSDGTAAMLQSEYSSISALNLEENMASAGGFAKGMEYAHKNGYEWVLLFNDDSRPTRGSLSEAVAHLSNPAIDMLKIANTNKDDKAVLLYWKGVRSPKHVALSSEPVETDLVTFDGCFISKAVMDAIEYCDPLYFMGTYEFDYCLKASKAGFGIYTLPNGKIEDDKLGSAQGTPAWRQYYNTRNHLWLALHNRSWQTFQAWFVRELKYMTAIVVKGNNKGEKLLFKLRAVRDAIRGKRGKVYLP